MYAFGVLSALGATTLTLDVRDHLLTGEVTSRAAFGVDEHAVNVLASCRYGEEQFEYTTDGPRAQELWRLGSIPLKHAYRFGQGELAQSPWSSTLSSIVGGGSQGALSRHSDIKKALGWALAVYPADHEAVLLSSGRTTISPESEGGRLKMRVVLAVPGDGPAHRDSWLGNFILPSCYTLQELATQWPREFRILQSLSPHGERMSEVHSGRCFRVFTREYESSYAPAISSCDDTFKGVGGAETVEI